MAPGGTGAQVQSDLGPERWLLEGLKSKKSFMRQGCALALGALKTPSAIDPILENGRVYLHGLVLASEVALLLAAIHDVEGVTEVENRLEVRESPKDLAAFRKGAKRWVGPAARVLTGTTGSALALAGLKNKNVALGAVGLGILAHGLANPDVKQLAGRLHLSKNGRAKNGRAEEPVSTLEHHQLEDEDRFGWVFFAARGKRRGDGRQEKERRRRHGRRGPTAHGRCEIVGGSHWCLRHKPQAPLWFHLELAHVLVGEPASTSPGHALSGAAAQRLQIGKLLLDLG